ncbi:MAG: hypothetical protein KA175_06635 [Flavobacteriales bacterium]|nr:hypothetical protein [Flavobacteriales bacterium]MBP6697277.1 hypothetical protein [Flavobacteriales bacterium]
MLTFLLIHVVLPLLGIAAYLLLARRMSREHVDRPPNFEWFVVFFVYGGALQLALTVLFWKWSGMTSLGAAFLILLAPFIMGGIAFSLRKRRTTSVYHNHAFRWSLVYPLVPLMFVLWGLTLE